MPRSTDQPAFARARTPEEVAGLTPIALKTIPVLIEALGLSDDEAFVLLQLDDLQDPTKVAFEALYRVSYMMGYLDQLGGLAMQGQLDVSPAEWMHSAGSVEWMGGRSPVQILIEGGLSAFDRLSRAIIAMAPKCPDTR